MAELAARGKWTLDQHLAAAQINELRNLLWVQGGCKQENKPEMVLCPCCEHSQKEQGKETMIGDKMSLADMADFMASQQTK